ncbi:OmpA family protein [Riemerella anatipestifer]|uniref:OmpA family protein n=1 Tax=Riemerella anatipestifer TaxID=34085 RepID=A0AAP6HFG5_RIEAN|nr:OmpA family protein [Riemerella anatipestifer]MBT0549472.1 OmpA family protein [Riemerella anatipestifer]MBT0556705.1 OmpA family protein [Riemerella anatipestifer]MBT0560235.1 OmpA family protein [Riemerella anatipestifer]MCD5967854.1 OmpA family protein [Riemerella anatipestifer]MCO7354289.1 OmpA family protein [Riemerella anatipestifer]
MKKYIFAVAAISFVVSCKKIQPGGNKNILKLEEGVERYTDDAQGNGHSTHAEGHQASGAKEEVTIDLEGVTLKGYKGGMEDTMLSFLKSGKYASSSDDVLKNVWYDFDHVNFKMGSTNQLESGAEQIDNLAKILKAYPDAKIKIGGYTDKTGSEETNVKISQARAEFIKAQLEKAGVGAQVVSAEGYGSKFAKVAADASDAERASDRKMSVRFTK